jgi:hypothetical protein
VAVFIAYGSEIHLVEAKDASEKASICSISRCLGVNQEQSLRRQASGVQVPVGGFGSFRRDFSR